MRNHNKAESQPSAIQFQGCLERGVIHEGRHDVMMSCDSCESTNNFGIVPSHSGTTTASETYSILFSGLLILYTCVYLGCIVIEGVNLVALLLCQMIRVGLKRHCDSCMVNPGRRTRQTMRQSNIKYHAMVFVNKANDHDCEA